jgi:hypothetical protein
MSAPQATPTALHWREIVPEEPGRHLSHFEAFDTFVAERLGSVEESADIMAWLIAHARDRRLF